VILGDSESEASWSEMLGDLQNRGLLSLELIVSADHKGLEDSSI
jgi:transposase-like protein